MDTLALLAFGQQDRTVSGRVVGYFANSCWTSHLPRSCTRWTSSRLRSRRGVLDCEVRTVWSSSTITTARELLTEVTPTPLIRALTCVLYCTKVGSRRVLESM